MSYTKLFVSKSAKTLAEQCPEKFKRNNPWSKFVNIILHRDDYNSSKWNWKDSDSHMQHDQFFHLQEIILSKKIRLSEKNSVVCWMLSEILNEVPVYSKDKCEV